MDVIDSDTDVDEYDATREFPGPDDDGRRPFEVSLGELHAPGDYWLVDGATRDGSTTWADR